MREQAVGRAMALAEWRRLARCCKAHYLSFLFLFGTAPRRCVTQLVAGFAKKAEAGNYRFRQSDGIEGNS